MLRINRLQFALICLAGALLAPLLSGCGTTRSTDTVRTATEQMLTIRSAKLEEPS